MTEKTLILNPLLGKRLAAGGTAVKFGVTGPTDVGMKAHGRNTAMFALVALADDFRADNTRLGRDHWHENGSVVACVIFTVQGYTAVRLALVIDLVKSRR